MVCELPTICSLKNVIYECQVTENTGPYPGHKESYIGLTKGRFIARKRKHDTSILTRDSRTATTLSEHVHMLKEGEVDYSIEWKILQQARSFDGANQCQLCLAEKSRILYATEPTLNKRSELFAKCCHRDIYRFKPPDDEPLSSTTSTQTV